MTSDALTAGNGTDSTGPGDQGGAGESAVMFAPDRKRLVHLVFWNTVATFATLGLYRFWARTRLRRYFWHRVAVAGAPADYLGRGQELFGGFAVAFAILAVVVTATLFWGISATAGHFDISIVNLAVYTAIVALLPVALYRARRYRLGRTVWRGVRFSQTGSSLEYATIWFSWLIVTVLTLGLAYPWRNVATESYRMRHTRFGTTAIGFSARAGDLLGRWLPAWVCWLGMVIGGGALGAWYSIYTRVSAAKVGINDAPVAAPWSDFYALSPAIWAGLLLVSTVAFFFAFLRYRVGEFRYFASRVSLNGATLTSDLKTRDVLRGFGPLCLGMIGYLLISTAMVAIMVRLVLVLPDQSSAAAAQTWGMIGLTLACALAILFLASYGISLLFNLTMRIRVIGALASSLSIQGLARVEEIEQDEQARDLTGEGLADAFQFGNF